MEQNLVSMNEKLYQSENTCEKQQQDMQIHENTIKELRTEITTLKLSVADLSAQTTDLQTQVVQKLTTNNQELLSANNNLQERIKVLNNTINSKDMELKQQMEKIRLSEVACEERNVKIVQLESEIASRSSTINELKGLNH